MKCGIKRPDMREHVPKAKNGIFAKEEESIY